MVRVVPLVCMALALLVPPARAQLPGVPTPPAAEALSRTAPKQAPPVDLLLLAGSPGALVDPAEVFAPRVAVVAEGRDGAPSLHRSLLHTIGGAAVGAWIGYFTSQLFRSDWDKESDQEAAGYRMGFALGGAALGGAGGLVIGTRSPPSYTGSARSAEPARDAITREQIQLSGAANAYDLVQSLHPEWLRARGVKSLTEGDRIEGGMGGTMVIRGTESRLVYLDEARVGGMETLRQIPITEVGSVRFLDAAAATYRWGTGHPHGVIWVTSYDAP